jgi:EmrB/QacA subfamily drug resistance transporter
MCRPTDHFLQRLPKWGQNKTVTTSPASSDVSSPTAQTAAASPAANQPDPNRWWTLVAVSLGTFMLLVDITIINVALPDIQKQLDASFSDLQWVIDAYALTLASLLLTTGSLADLYGRRKLYILGLGVFTVASLVCGLSTSPLMLILARGSQGIGGAIMFSVSLALLAGAFSGRERGVAFGIWGAITGLAVAIGPLLGGALTSGLSWRWIFFVNLPIGLVAIALTRAKVTESLQRGARRPDWWGFVTFSAALSALVFGLIRSGEKGWGNGQVIVPFIAAAVLMIVFVAIEARGRFPMFDLSLFRLPTFVGGSLAAFSLSASLFALQLYLVLYVQDVLGYSAFQTGVRFLVLSGGILLTSTVAGRLTSHVPIRLLIGPGLLLVGVGLLLMRRIDPASDWTALAPGLFIAGVGTGLVNPPLASTAVGVVEPARSGMASGINSTFRQVGIATGIATFGSLFASAVTNQVTKGLHGAPPQLAGQLSSAVKNGAASQAVAAVPDQLRPVVAAVAKDSFVYGLRQILLLAAIVALVGGVLSLLLIRNKDFAGASHGSGGGATGGQAGGGERAGGEGSGADAAGASPAHESRSEQAEGGVSAPTSAPPLTPAPPPLVPAGRLRKVTGPDASPAAASPDAASLDAASSEADNASTQPIAPVPGGRAAARPSPAGAGPDVHWVVAANGSANRDRGLSSPRGGRVTGRVEHTDGRPFEGVPVTITTEAGEPVALVASDADGRYEVPVETGAYIVIASPRGCQPDARRTWVGDGSETEPADFVLDGDSLLYGRVRGATGGVVTLLDADGAVVAGTDIETDGSYEVAGLRGGLYTVTTMVPGTSPAAHQVEVLPGDAREYELGLGPADLGNPYADTGDTYPDPGLPPESDGVDDGGHDGPFSPGLHPVAMVAGGTGIAGLPNGAGRGNGGVADGSPTQPLDASRFASGPDRENN